MRGSVPSSSSSATRAPYSYDFRTGRTAPSGASSAASTTAKAARPLEPGVSAKETAAAYNAWQKRADAGKATIDEAYAIVARHAKSGGDPAPYVRRMKYTVYQEIRDFRGETRQAGDKERGRLFATVKALPDDLAGAQALRAIQRDLRAKAVPKPKTAAA